MCVAASHFRCKHSSERMDASKEDLWSRFQQFYFEYPSIGMALDLSRVNFKPGFFESMAPRMEKAFQAMAELEKGAIANPDENRMVGHYWLRNPALAPTPEIRKEIEDTVNAIKAFAADVHSGTIRGSGGPFTHILLIGIGGSALGPQFVSKALARPGGDRMQIRFFDNTDPDGMNLVLSELRPVLDKTLCLVISKSGGTKETRNGMLEAQAAFQQAKIDFGKHAVAVTGEGSELDRYAEKNGWIRRFPMWDWVGGRTSEMSAVGLLPAALQGFDVDALLRGARECDSVTRATDKNPAALLAEAIHYIVNGRGDKSMVVLPYSDRLELFSKYLQQLVMESLGKELDLNGNVVHQGLTVFGNKGSTDQHAYVQQLRDGLDNFFVCFIHVLENPKSIDLEPNVTSGDYLNGFYLGTREALFDKNRQGITITLKELSAFSVGVLIALFERGVGLYASLINVNAYHQPGVEAGKKAAAKVLALQIQILQSLQSPMSSEEIAKRIGSTEVETVFHICEHLAANDRLKRVRAQNPFDARYSLP